MRSKFAILALVLFVVAGCAGPNPNAGERTTDMAWTSGNYQRAFDIAKSRAEAGEPWAQLRMGIFYTNGWGTQVDIEQAEYWYKNAASQKSTGKWAEGKIASASGRSGYFNQNSDARIAQFNLAQLYFENDKNLQQAKVLIDEVIKETDGKSIFFCCEFSGGRYFRQEQILELKRKIDSKLSTQ